MNRGSTSRSTRGRKRRRKDDQAERNGDSDDHNGSMNEVDESGAAEGKKERESRSKQGILRDDLKTMMYGFGDSANPLPETIDLMESIALEYVHDMTVKSMQVAQKRGKLQADDLVFLIRKDKKKYARVHHLLRLQKEIQERQSVNFKELAESSSSKR